MQAFDHQVKGVEAVFGFYVVGEIDGGRPVFRLQGANGGVEGAAAVIAFQAEPFHQVIGGFASGTTKSALRRRISGNRQAAMQATGRPCHYGTCNLRTCWNWISPRRAQTRASHSPGSGRASDAS